VFPFACSGDRKKSHLNFLDSYLRPREVQVVVEGTVSDEFEVANTVFQATVLGPLLWNAFFRDMTVPAYSTGGGPSLFANDLNVFQEFERHTDDGEIM